MGDVDEMGREMEMEAEMRWKISLGESNKRFDSIRRLASGCEGWHPVHIQI